MSSISIREMLECGVHFGHPTRRWNPKMKKYIFGERNGISIIDLQRSARLAKKALKFVQNTAAEGGTIMFIGTKRQAADVIREQAERCEAPYVNYRWLGGLMTNFSTIQQSIRKLKNLEEMVEDEERTAHLKKKELLKLGKERDRLDKVLHGIKDMRRLPSVVFVVDVMKEHIAVAEARKLNIPIVAIVDSNCDPDDIDYVIPGNDDAIRSIGLFAEKVSDAVLEGSKMFEAKKAEEERRKAEEKAALEKRRAEERAKRDRERKQREEAAKKQKEAKAAEEKKAEKAEKKEAAGGDAKKAEPDAGRKPSRAKKKETPAKKEEAEKESTAKEKKETKAEDKKESKAAEAIKDEKKADSAKAEAKEKKDAKAEDKSKADAAKKDEGKADASDGKKEKPAKKADDSKGDKEPAEKAADAKASAGKSDGADSGKK